MRVLIGIRFWTMWIDIEYDGLAEVWLVRHYSIHDISGRN